MRRFIFLFCMILPMVMLAKTYSVDEVPNVQVSDRSKLLSNPDGLISPAVAQQIDSVLCNIRADNKSEVAVVVVDDIDQDINDFATELFRHWGIGRKGANTGVLMIVANDSRQAVIRTGYGAEGVLPDIITGRIIHDIMFPRFRKGDLDGGVLLAVQEMHRLLTNPEASAELQAQLQQEEDEADRRVIVGFLSIGVGAGIVMLLVLVWVLYNCRGKSDYEKYLYTNKFTLAFWVITAFFLGTPIIAAVVLTQLRRHWRNHSRSCPHCNAKMQKLDEDTDNRYLNTAQDLEERIKSVDYDVWLCPKCGHTDIWSFVNDKSLYQECDKCHARTMKLNGTSVIQPATTTREGIGEKSYVCLNCHNVKHKRYTIAKSAPVVIAPVGGRGGGFGGFGGGSIGGGFGGGLTGGGGASGRW